MVDLFAFELLAELFFDDLLFASVDVHLAFVLLFVLALVHVHMGLEFANNLLFVLWLLLVIVLNVLAFLLDVLLLLFTFVLLLFFTFVLDLLLALVLHLLLVIFSHPLDLLVVLLLLVLLILIIDLHSHLLSLKHHQLLLLGLVKDVDTSILTSCWWNTVREVSKLVELIEVLSSLEKDLLVFSEMVIWIEVCVPENSNVLLEVFDLVVQVDELLGLLLDE